MLVNGNIYSGQEIVLAEIRKTLEHDYGAKRHRTACRAAFSMHSDLGGVLVELLQNAEDAGATELVGCVWSARNSGGIYFENDGRPFSQEDLLALCSLFASQKNLDDIGFLGIGFKAVLQLTETPYLVSGSFCCKLEGGMDPYPASPDELPFAVSADRTVFWLPFREGLDRDYVELHLQQKLDGYGPKLLLFLDCLSRVKWEGRNDSVSFYAEREPLGEVDGGVKAYKVTVSNGMISEWLRFDLFRNLPEEVVNCFLEQRRDLEEEEERVRGSIGKPIKLSLAIGLEDNAPAEVKGLVFAGLPTKERTGLRFHVCAPFRTNFSREGLKDVRENPLGEWLLGHLAELVRRLPSLLNSVGYLKPRAWHLFPDKGEGDGVFRSLAEGLLDTLCGGRYVHDTAGNLRTPQEVFLAHRAEAYELFSSADVEELTEIPGGDWVHPDLRTGRAREALKSVQVKEIGAEEIVGWIERKLSHSDCASSRTIEWLVAVYRYLGELKPTSGLWAKARELPMVPTRSGQLIRPAEAHFPPDDESVLEPEFREYLSELDGVVVADDIVRDNTTKEFLKRAGVRDFDWGRVVDRLLEREYVGRKPAPEINSRHLRLLKGLCEKGQVSDKKIEDIGKKFCLLRDRSGNYVRPDNVYLSHEYASSEEERVACESVEKFFSLSGGRSFVSPVYLDADTAGLTAVQQDFSSGQATGEGSEAERWRRFLLKLGVTNRPRLCEWRIEDTSWLKIEDEAERRGFSMPEYTPGHRISLNDWEVDGLDQALAHLAKESVPVEKARVVWETMAWLYHQLDLDKSLYYVQYAKLRWFRYRPQSDLREAAWLRKLRESRWLPERKGRACLPQELYAHELEKVMGSGFLYLHPDLPTARRRKFAETLGIRFTAGTEAVLENLGNIAGIREAEQGRVRPLYEYLSRQKEDQETIRDAFRQNRLILVPGYGWFTVDEVCWHDRLGVVPSLKSCWHDLEDLFVQMLGVAEEPQPEQYAQALVCLSNNETSVPPLEQLAELYREIWKARQQGKLQEEMWNRLRFARCWLGQQGQEQFCWATVRELVRRDNMEIARLFEGKVTWWAITDLKELADALEVRLVSQAQPVVKRKGKSLGEVNESTHKLAEIWPYLRRLLQHKVPGEPPRVCQVTDLEVCYALGDVESQPVPVFSWYCQAEEELLVTGGSNLGLDEEMAEALRTAVREESVSELAKDLFHALRERQRLEFLLKNKWCGRFGLEYTELLSGISGTVPEPQAFEPGAEQEDAGRGDGLVRIKGSLSPAEATGDNVLPGEEEVAVAQEQMEDLRQAREGKEVNGSLEPPAGPTHPEVVEHREKGFVRIPGPSSALPSGFGRNGVTAGETPFTGRRLTPTEERAEVERAAVDAAKRWLESEGYKVYEEAAYDVGHDLRCVRNDGSQVWVEVKGRSGQSFISLTEKQWRQAEEKGENYWLLVAIVERSEAKGVRALYRIKNPARFKFERRETTAVEYEAEANSWQEWAEKII